MSIASFSALALASSAEARLAGAFGSAAQAIAARSRAMISLQFRAEMGLDVVVRVGVDDVRGSRVDEFAQGTLISSQCSLSFTPKLAVWVGSFFLAEVGRRAEEEAHGRIVARDELHRGSTP
jgi:hypothetical protein